MKRSAASPMKTKSCPPTERMSGVRYGSPGCAAMIGSVTSSVGDGPGVVVASAEGLAAATGEGGIGVCVGAEIAGAGPAQAERTVATARTANFIRQRL